MQHFVFGCRQPFYCFGYRYSKDTGSIHTRDFFYFWQSHVSLPLYYSFLSTPLAEHSRTTSKSTSIVLMPAIVLLDTLARSVNSCGYSLQQTGSLSNKLLVSCTVIDDLLRCIQITWDSGN